MSYSIYSTPQAYKIGMFFFFLTAKAETAESACLKHMPI